MANQNEGLGNLALNLTADGSQFSNTLKGIRSDLKFTQQAMKTNEASFKAAGKTYEGLEQKINDLSVVMKANQKQIDILRDKHKQAIATYGEGSEQAKRYAKQLNEAKMKQSNFSTQMQRTTQQFADMTAEMKRNGQAISNTANDTMRLSRELTGVEINAREASDSLDEMGKTKFSGLKGALGDLTGIAAGFLGTITAGITGLGTLSAQTEAQLSKLKAQTGLTAKEAEKYRDIINDINNQGVHGYEETSEALAQVIQKSQGLNLSKKDISSLVKSVLNDEAIFQQDAGEGANARIAMKRLFGADIDEINDLITKGMQSGLNVKNDFTDQISEFGPLLQEMFKTNPSRWFSILDQGMKNGAYNIDKINSTMEEFVTGIGDGKIEEMLKAQGGEAAKLWDSYAKGKISLDDLFVATGNYLNTLDPIEAKQLAVEAGMTSLDTQGVKIIDNLDGQAKAWENVSGASAKANDEMTKTPTAKIKGALNEVKNAVAPLGKTISDLAGSGASKAADVISGLVDGFNDLGPSAKSAIGIVTGIATAVAAVVAGIGAWSAVSGIVSGVLATMSGAIAPVIAPILGIAGAIAAVVLGFKYFWKSSEQFRNAVKGIADVAKTIGTAVKDLVATYLMKLYEIFKDRILPILKDFASYVGGAITGLLEKLKTAWSENEDSILGFINILKKVTSFLADVLAPIVGTVFKIVFAVIKGYIQNIVNVISSVIDIFSGLIKFLTGVFTGNWSKAWEGIKQIFKGALILIINFVSMIFIGKILGLFKGLFTGATGIIKNLWSKVTGFFSSGLNKVKDLTTSVKNKIPLIFEQMGKAISKKFSSIVSDAKSVPTKILNGFSSMKTKLVNKMKEIGNGMKNGLISGLNGMIDGVNWVLGKLGLSKYKIGKISVSTESTGSTKKSTGGYVPKYHNGTPLQGHRGGTALINDSKGPKHREAVILPNGQVIYPQGKNLLVDLPKGSHVIPGHASEEFLKRLNVPKYASGTGLWESIKNIGEGVWDAVTNPTKFFKDMISKIKDFTGSLSSLPKTIAKGAFNFTTDKASEWFKKIMNSDDAQSKNAAGGPATATSGKLSGQWRVVSELINLAGGILPRFKNAVITSGLRPGARTAAGTLSDHALGKALDISGYGRNGSPMYTQIAEQFFKSPYVQYVIANNKWKWKGRFGWKNYPYGGHMNHTHISAFANGGIVDSPTYGVFGEAGREALIPLSQSRKTRGVQLLNEAATQLGQKVVPNGNKDQISLMQTQIDQQSKMINLLAQLVMKDTSIEIDGKQVAKTIAPEVKNEIETIDKRNRRSRGLI